MRISLYDLWGCGRGPLMRASPQVRLVAGVTAFAGSLVAPGATASGSLCAGGIAAVWVVACGPPLRVLRASILLGLALLLPYFLLVPLLPGPVGDTAQIWRGALGVPWTILLRGLSTMLVCVGTVTAVTAGDLREALLRLPVPSIISAILLQIIHQTGTLFTETQRVASAMAVRGASSRSPVAWRVLFSLPQVWLPRIIDRAERVGAAMELRGYGDGPTPSFHRATLGLFDVIALGAAAGALALAISLRIWGSP